MRILLVAGLAALCLVPAALAATPHVWLADRSPVAVRGSGFQPGERVAVRVFLGKGHGSVAKTVTARAGGAIAARFAVDASGGCRTVTVTAVGDRGSRATWKTPPPACGADPAPAG